jgi:hypothetical protein
MVAAGERCSWPRPLLSFPLKAAGGCQWWIVLALLGPSRLHGCVSVGDSWRWWAGGSLGSTTPARGSGPLLPSPGWPSSSSVTLWGSDPAFCKCPGGGGGGLQHSLEDARVLAVGGGGGGVSDVLKRGGCGIVGGAPACGIGTVASQSSGALSRYRAGSCRSGCSGGLNRAYGIRTV